MVVRPHNIYGVPFKDCTILAGNILKKVFRTAQCLPFLSLLPFPPPSHFLPSLKKYAPLISAKRSGVRSKSPPAGPGAQQ